MPKWRAMHLCWELAVNFLAPANNDRQQRGQVVGQRQAGQRSTRLELPVQSTGDVAQLKHFGHVYLHVLHMSAPSDGIGTLAVRFPMSPPAALPANG